MTALTEERWVSIGKITAPHGLRGEVRVLPLTDVEDRFEQVHQVFVLPRGDQTRFPVQITKVAYRKNLVIVRTKEITDVDQAETLRDALIQVPIDEVAPLPDGTYYVFQLVGLKVVCFDGTHIGTVSDVITASAANDIYVVEREGHEPALIPAVREFVKEINLEQGHIVIDPIPGLL